MSSNLNVVERLHLISVGYINCANFFVANEIYPARTTLGKFECGGASIKDSPVLPIYPNPQPLC